VTALYPALLDLRDARLLVVGGGAVAARKVETLVESGGRPDIVAPELAAPLAATVERLGLSWSERPYRSGDPRGYQLVVAATHRREVNALVAREAREHRAWVNVADDPGASTFHVPATVREGEVTVAVSTGGASPLLAGRLRERIGAIVTPGLARAIERLRGARAEVQARWPDEEERRRAFWFALITQEFLDCAIAGQDEEVNSRIEACLSQS
jgi:precorrin-2 dehydrogenase / sirohydrochlorin ferrochelatase